MLPRLSKKKQTILWKLYTLYVEKKKDILSISYLEYCVLNDQAKVKMSKGNIMKTQNYSVEIICRNYL